MDSPIVIKVKYGDTLRRFTAYADEKGLRDLNMAGLKNKIHTLFNFPLNADLTMTYTDEDKDEVTLVNDNDLYDATTQKLNPLRMTVVTNRVRPPRGDYKSANSWGRTESIRVVRSPTPITVKGAIDDVRTKETKEAFLKMEEDFNNLKAKSIVNDSSESSYTTTHSSSQGPIQAIKTPPVLSPNETGFPASNGNRCDKTSSGIGAVKRDFIKSGRVCHIGVQCDGCLVYPIMGPRFKSKVKEDYDLCSVCFATMGNETEYKQIDAPITVHCPGLAKNFTDMDAFLWRSANRVQGVEAPSTCPDGPVDTESVNNCNPADDHNEIAAEAVNLNSVINEVKSKDQHFDLHVNNGSFIVDCVSAHVTPVDPAGGSNPCTEASLVEHEHSTTADTCSMKVDVNYVQMLLDILEQMGFKQTDLNKEILRKNEFNLNQSITDLCDMSQWDAILLEELEQMGLCDKETNVKLLKKNEGSILQVVMDLL